MKRIAGEHQAKHVLTKAEEEKLVRAAVSARKNAYCPYSGYPVGASVLTGGGAVYTGCNVENASLGLTCCAERTAIFNAVSAGDKDIKAVCVAAKSAKPCGACRQVMIEFMDKDSMVIMVDVAEEGGIAGLRKTKISQLLPAAFNPSEAGL